MMPGEWDWMTGGNTDVSGYGDDTLSQMELKRKLKLAQELQNQQVPQGQMVGNRYIAPSWTQHLANLAGNLFGAVQEKQAIKDYGEFQKTKQQKQAEALDRFGKVFEPKKVVTQGTYEIQKPVEEDEVKTYPYMPPEKLGATSPWTNNLNQTTKTIQVPMATTEERQPTMDDIRAGFAQYARDTRNPKLLEDMYMKQYTNLMSPKKYSIHNIGDVGIVLDENGRPTGEKYDFNKPAKPTDYGVNANSTARGLFNKDFADLTQPEQLAVVNKMNEWKEKAAGVQSGRLGIEQTKSDYETKPVETTYPAPTKKLSPQDQQALDWARKNPNDPRAKAVKQRLGV